MVEGLRGSFYVTPDGQTIKSWLYAKIQDVHRGRWDQEEDVRIPCLPML